MGLAIARNPQGAAHLLPGHYGLPLVGLYLLAFGSALIYGPVYWLRDRDSSLVKSIAYAHLFTALRLHVGSRRMAGGVADSVAPAGLGQDNSKR